jgi:hypothetical protein
MRYADRVTDLAKPPGTDLAKTSADPLSHHDYLGVDPALEATFDDSAVERTIRSVLKFLDVPLSIEAACFAADITPETFEKWVTSSPRLAKAIRRRMALLEKKLIQEMRKGGKGFPRAKAALTVLERNFKRWEAKTTISIAKTFDEALDELEKTLDPETFALVLGILEKHA